jgi:8-amino-7-oxononanoate synthase
VRSIVDSWAGEALAALEADSLRRSLEPLETPVGARVRIEGRELLNFSSNDYLGLAANELVRQAAQAALALHGVGAGASRLVVGDTPAHQSLERALAKFEGTERALLFNSGYAANVGALTSLFGVGDVVFSDELNHASLIDGCRLSRAKVVVYPHRDVEALEALVRATPGRRRAIVTDTVFSMDGDRAPVRGLRELADRHELALLVDEAHATGVLGPGGRGLCALEGVTPDVHVGTLSKAIGAFGGFVCGSQALCELLLNRARPLIFSTALPAAICAAAERALELISDGGLQARLAGHVAAFATALGARPDSAIFPVVVGAATRALELSASLRERGFLVKAIRPPTVATSRLRIALSAAHSRDEVMALASCLSPIAPQRSPLVRVHEHAP